MKDIELVIKIPEEMYEALRKTHMIISSGQRSGKTLMSVIYNAVSNGTPLPKGHGKLVDYEELKSNAREYGAYAETTLSHIKPKIIIEADKEELDANSN